MREDYTKKNAGVIYLVGTPIGNLSDITLRALDILKNVDVVAAEDTRRTLKLLNHYGIKKPLLSYHKYNEREQAEKIIERAKSGKAVAVVSDAGVPGVSDPGRILVERAREENIDILPIPGVSAVTALLSVTGFPCVPYFFAGFPPARGKERAEFFKELSQQDAAIVLFEAPSRFRRTLKDILEVLGDREVTVGRELTKIHEEIFVGTISDALKKWTEGVRGEITLVIRGQDKRFARESKKRVFDGTAEKELERLVHEEGFTWRDAISRVSEVFAIPRSEVYRKAMQIKKTR